MDFFLWLDDHIKSGLLLYILILLPQGLATFRIVGKEYIEELSEKHNSKNVLMLFATFILCLLLGHITLAPMFIFLALSGLLDLPFFVDTILFFGTYIVTMFYGIPEMFQN